MSLAETIRTHVREHRSGMLTDLLFALAWVTVVSVLFDVLDGPQWAFYLCMGAGVVAYFGFFASVEAAREKR
ncbi:MULTISPECIES: hypothetical protein [Haloferax]|jgi:hypothetical protein|uniref:DUF8119 domain-containing protein n=4 Tax=Haloferax TaxID=2251 RepID=A0A6C0UTE2_HALVO|nr:MULTISPECIES: hypothetical protein [Haloferax]ELK46947.1 hypothetical protein D320_20434 [Haloferax sp. BAB-2207]ELZ72644.1 hypothetical protein C456_13733 [Haloferax lucentense DSM 14919]ELZ89861.1 hypothetical protein C452_11190 [Haloferax alexandrinus JCM 10717]MBC9987821.1 hypothetical protein [Haloferax sp. AS1]NLV02661.1 hypothetical protein [Haloferax alexandrinus]